MEKIRTQVLIVGGGAAGLTSSMLLSKAGVDSMLIERHASTSILPKAHVLNQPTMEVFSELGVAEEIYQRGTPRLNMARTTWATSLTGPTSLHGRKIGATSCFGSGALMERYDRASPCHVANLPQIRLEPMLRRRAEVLAPGRVRFHQELVSFSQDESGVLATVLDRDSKHTYEVVADYLIGADGGRSVGPSLGVIMEGEQQLISMVSAHLSADLSKWVDDDSLINFYINPDGAGSMGSGVLVKMGPDHWGAQSEEWVFHAAFRADDPAQFDQATMLKRMRDCLGMPEFDPKIHVVSQWQVQGTVASRFKVDRTFLIGDAVHRHPPTTGLGLNTAVADAYSLAWKIAAVLKRQAASTLLETHETERKPVARLVVHQALSSFFQHQNIDAAMGLAPGQSVSEGWQQMAKLYEASAEGDAMRASVSKAISDHLEFGALNVELGYVYETGAVLGDGTAAPDNPDPVRLYQPSARPGHRLPHAWLDRDGERKSTFDLCRGALLTLIIGDQGLAWRDGVAQINSRYGQDIRVLLIGEGGWRDVGGTWRRHRGVGESGAVLIRPDARVAWRSDHPGDSAAAQLDAAVVAVLGKRGDAK